MTGAALTFAVAAGLLAGVPFGMYLEAILSARAARRCARPHVEPLERWQVDRLAELLGGAASAGGSLSWIDGRASR